MNDSNHENRSADPHRAGQPKRRGQGNLLKFLIAVGIIGIPLSLVSVVIRSMIEKSDQASCRGNLRQIGLALFSYQDKYGTLPPGYLAAEDGTPMHSWRVLILPFLNDRDAQELYDRYRFDEPWNGPNNRKLADRMPGVFRCQAKAYPHWWSWITKTGRNVTTDYVVLNSPMTAFPGSLAIDTEKILDGAFCTLLVVELDKANGIHWMAPQDFHPVEYHRILYAGPPGGKQHPGRLFALVADKNVRSLKEVMDTPMRIHYMSTIEGCEVFPEEAEPFE